MLVVFCGAASWFWTQGEGSSLLQSMFFCSIRYGFTQLQQRSQQDSAVSFVVTCEGFGRRYRGVCSCQGTLSFAPWFLCPDFRETGCHGLENGLLCSSPQQHASRGPDPKCGTSDKALRSLSLATDSVAVSCPCLLPALLWKCKGRGAQL